MRRLTLSEETKNEIKLRKTTWRFIFKSVAELCPDDNPSFAEEQEKLSTILDIVESLTGKELNDFASKMRTKTEYQMLYRDGHWLSSPEQYNTKTQLLIDHIFNDLRDYRTEILADKLGKAVKKAFK